MDYSKKQMELDLIKWIDSETKSYDTCGEYSYCSHCNKSEAYPCACAYEKYTSLATAIKSATKSSTSTRKLTTTTSKKTTCARKTTSTSKKTTTKAPATRKTTTSKTTTRKTVKA